MLSFLLPRGRNVSILHIYVKANNCFLLSKLYWLQSHWWQASKQHLFEWNHFRTRFHVLIPCVLTSTSLIWIQYLRACSLEAMIINILIALYRPDTEKYFFFSAIGSLHNRRNWVFTSKLIYLYLTVPLMLLWEPRSFRQLSNKPLCSSEVCNKWSCSSSS